MDTELLNYLRKISPEEQLILEGNTDIHKELYTSQENFVIDSKKLLAKGLIEKYTLETNKKEVYFKLTDQGMLLFEEHDKRHKRWEKRDMEFLARYSKEEVSTVYKFMQEFNDYLENQIESIAE